MKRLIFLSLFIIALSSICCAETFIESFLGVSFGQTCTIKAEFVDKPNTYYAQNISHAGYYLKIIEINDKKLLEPLIVEPVYKNIAVKKNEIYSLQAYETIRSEGEPSDWSDMKQQLHYTIIRKIVIKLL